MRRAIEKSSSPEVNPHIPANVGRNADAATPDSLFDNRRVGRPSYRVSSVPRISYFYGIAIWMYWNEGVQCAPTLPCAGTRARLHSSGVLELER